MEIFTSSKDKGDALLNSISDVGCTITEEQKNLTNIALKLELQDILSKKTLYEPLVIEQVKKLMPLCVKPFSDTLNIQHLSKGKWATIKEIYIKPPESKASGPILPQVLSYQVNENILTLSKIITNFLQINKHNIISPFISSDKLDLRRPLDSDIFSKNYSLIQPYLPKEIYNKSPVQKTEKSFFHALKEIEELKEAYIKYSDDHLNMIASFLETIRKFYKAENIGQTTHFQGILGNYIYFLNQQWKALSFCKKLYPQSKDFEPLKDVIKEAKKILIEENLLDKAILDIKLQNKEKIEYYTEALKWLGKFTGKQSELVAVINEIKANAHYYLGMIYENSNLELDWFRAIREYTNALEIDKNFNFNYDYGNEQITFKGICEKIGNLFLNLGRFYKSKNENGTVIKLLQEAIKYFKISLSIVPVEKCSFILREIFNVPKDKKEEKHYLSLEKDLYISLAEFLFKLNLIPQAAFEYYRAASISNLQEEQKLLLKIQEVYDTKMKENTAFIRSMLDKGRMEDLSIVTKEANRTKFLSDTHIIIDDFVPPSNPQAEQQVNNQQEIVQYQTEQQHNNKPEAPQAHNELLLGHDEERQAIVQQHNTQLNDRQLLDEQQLMMQLEWGLQAAGVQNPSKQQANDKKEINKQNDIQHRQSQPTANTPLHTIENIQKPGYWYTVDDILNILEANIDKDKFSIVTHVDLANPEQVRDALREGVHEDLHKKSKVVLMSINTGHAHWVSMTIHKMY